jgi:predicted DNA-binding antitoxin AbrB/MazE fold protein
MSITIDAIYENGVLRLKGPIPLPERAPVRVTIEAHSAIGANGDAQDAAAWLAQIAAMPMEPGGEAFSGQDHDRILYGPKGAR